MERGSGHGVVLWYEGEFDVVSGDEAAALTFEHLISERHADSWRHKM